MNIQNKAEGNRSIFRPVGVITLADIVKRANAELKSTARRDTASAFRCLATKLDVDLAAIPATAEAVRELVGDLTPGELGVSSKRLANLRSLIVRAVERFGMRRQVVTRAVPLSKAWSDLLARAEPSYYRHGLNRLGVYCSATGIAPAEVSPQALLGFHSALVAECFVKHPRKIIKLTIALWNHCMRTIEGWPPARLASPFKKEPDTLPLETFPESFRADVEHWITRMTRVDPLDLEAPVRPLRPATIKSYVMLFRRFASALVRRDILPLEMITGLDVFFEGDRFKDGLRHFLPESPGKTTSYVHYMATKLLHVARHYVRVPDGELTRLQALAARLDPKLPRGMSRRNRDRLEQFDEPDVIRRLLAFPGEERARALACRSPIRRAKAMERALAVSLLIHTGLRIKNLRNLRLDRNIRRMASGVCIELRAQEMKNEVELTLDLPHETIELLNCFAAEHRPLLPGHQGPYLFPGLDGGPRSYGAMRAAVSDPLRRHAGIIINPHLYRHAIAKIIVERNPEMYVAVSRRLGHKSINTTLGSYLGTETRAASRQINRLLDEARENPEMEG
jgi:integrase